MVGKFFNFLIYHCLLASPTRRWVHLTVAVQFHGFLMQLAILMVNIVATRLRPFVLVVNSIVKSIKPAIHLSSNWREREKILVKREKREVYRWHFVNRFANHFSHLAFHRSHHAIDIFTKRQRGRYGKFLSESKMNKIGDIVRSV